MQETNYQETPENINEFETNKKVAFHKTQSLHLTPKVISKSKISITFQFILLSIEFSQLNYYFFQKLS